MNFQTYYCWKLFLNSLHLIFVSSTFYCFSTARAQELEQTASNPSYTEASYLENTTPMANQENSRSAQEQYGGPIDFLDWSSSNPAENNIDAGLIVDNESRRSKRSSKLPITEISELVTNPISTERFIASPSNPQSYDLQIFNESRYSTGQFLEIEQTRKSADESSSLGSNNGSPYRCSGNSVSNRFSSFLALSYQVQGITGDNQGFFENAISEIVIPYLGRSIDCNDLDNIRDEITRFYIQEGYITSRAASLEGQQDGTLIIPIIEGYIDEIGVEVIQGEESEPASKLLEQYVNTQMSPVIPEPENGPVNFTDVENQVRLLALDPLFVQDSIYSVLKTDSDSQSNSPSNQYSDLIIYLEQEERLNIGLSFNNYSPPSLGSEGFDWQIGFNSRVFSYGERFYAGGRYNPFVDRNSSRTITTTSGGESSEFGGSNDSIAWTLGYSIPVGSSPRGGFGEFRLQVGEERKDILQGLASVFDFRSEVTRFSVDYRYPISRTLSEEWALVGGFTFEEGQTFINKTQPFAIGFGPDDEGTSRTAIFAVALEYFRRGSNNVLLSRGQVNLGTNLFDATQNSSPIPDGQFLSLFLQTQMSQRLSENHTLVLRGLTQLTPDSLLPINQFVIGGSQSVRGYRENIRSGDNGFIFSVGDRIDLFPHVDGEPQLQIIPFFDLGLVWNNGRNPNIIPNDTFLASLGVGMSYQPFRGKYFEPLTFRLDYGIPLVTIDSSGNNLQDSGVHFGVSYSISFF